MASAELSTTAMPSAQDDQLTDEDATAEHQAILDISAISYSEVLISKGVSEPNSRQVIQVVQTFLKESKG